jgi:uroporphyrinogen-III synthase
MATSKKKKKVVSKKKRISVKKVVKLKKAKKSFSKKVAVKKIKAKKSTSKTPTKAKAKIKGKLPAKKVVPKSVKVAVEQKKPKKELVKAAPAQSTLPTPEKSKRTPKKSVPQLPALKPIETSNFPKLKVKRLLVSQPKPESDKSPYLDLAKKYNLKIDFRQFIMVEGVAAKEFRQQRINILEHNAVILTSRIAIDHYFRMAAEMRLVIPETMKYFCISESIAYYLQKYVQYRKRKIFFGHQTILDLVDVIKKHREDKYLLPVSDVHREQIADFLDELQVKYTKATFYRTVAADLSDMKGVLDYDALVFFTPAGIRSLRKNFPGFRQGNTRIAAFGYNTALAVKEYGYRLDIHAPTPQSPSMTMALEQYIREANKR